MFVRLNLSPGILCQGIKSFLEDQSIRTEVMRSNAMKSNFDVCITDSPDSLGILAMNQSPIVVCSDFANRSDVVSAFKKGAAACVSLKSNFHHLRMAIDRVYQGKQYLCPTLSTVICQAHRISTPNELTLRERNVIVWIARGHSNKQIGRQLGLSPFTVESHKRNIMQKIGAHKITELAAYATRNGMT